MILYKKLGLFSSIHKTLINHSYICNPALQLEPEPGFYCLSMRTFTFQKRTTTLSLCLGLCWCKCSFSWMDRADLPWSDALHMSDLNGVPFPPHRCCFYGIFAIPNEQCDNNSRLQRLFMRNNCSLCIYGACLGFLPNKIPLVLIFLMRFKILRY